MSSSEFDVLDKIQELASRTSISFEELNETNFDLIIPRAEQQAAIEFMGPAVSKEIALSSKYKIYVSSETGPILAGGVCPHNPFVADLWLIVHEDIKKTYSKSFIYLMKQYLDLSPYEELYTPIRDQFPEGHRFAKTFGFENTGKINSDKLDGYDYFLYKHTRNTQENS